MLQDTADIGGVASRGRKFSALVANLEQGAKPLNLFLLGTSAQCTTDSSNCADCAARRDLKQAHSAQRAASWAKNTGNAGRLDDSFQANSAD